MGPPRNPDLRPAAKQRACIPSNPAGRADGHPAKLPGYASRVPARAEPQGIFLPAYHPYAALPNLTTLCISANSEFLEASQCYRP